MNFKRTEIIPFVGFDQIRLGQTLGQTELLLGKPSEINKEIFRDESLDMIMKYHDLGVDLTFSADDDFLLGSITFLSRNYLLKGISLIGLPEDEFLRMGSALYPDLQIDDHLTELNAKDYISDSNGLTFWIQDGIVESISIFPDYEDDDDTPIWPSKMNSV